MVGHEIAGVFTLLVAGGIIISVFQKGSITGQVLTAGMQGFAGLLGAMKGSSVNLQGLNSQNATIGANNNATS